MTQSPLSIIGQAEEVTLASFEAMAIPARVDTGAATSSLWVSNIVEKDHVLHFTLFDKRSPFYTGKLLTCRNYSMRTVTTSTGHTEDRFAIKTVLEIGGKKIKATFTLADRSTQVYPILIGRNVLRGKFIVDVKRGQRFIEQEDMRLRRHQQRLLKRKGTK